MEQFRLEITLSQQEFEILKRLFAGREARVEEKELADRIDRHVEKHRSLDPLDIPEYRILKAAAVVAASVEEDMGVEVQLAPEPWYVRGDSGTWVSAKIFVDDDLATSNQCGPRSRAGESESWDDEECEDDEECAEDFEPWEPPALIEATVPGAGKTYRHELTVEGRYCVFEGEGMFGDPEKPMNQSVVLIAPFQLSWTSQRKQLQRAVAAIIDAMTEGYAEDRIEDEGYASLYYPYYSISSIIWQSAPKMESTQLTHRRQEAKDPDLSEPEQFDLVAELSKRFGVDLPEDQW